MGKVVLLPIVTDYTSNTISYLIKQDSIKTPSETVENSDLKIYLAPNPSNNGRFKIVNTGKTLANNIMVKVFNKNGLLMKEWNTMYNIDINSEELPDDIYLLQILENQKIVKSLKLIIIH
jgi:hypothetical protein